MKGKFGIYILNIYFIGNEGECHISEYYFFKLFFHILFWLIYEWEDLNWQLFDSTGTYLEDGSVEWADAAFGASAGGPNSPDAGVCAAARHTTPCYLQQLWNVNNAALHLILWIYLCNNSFMSYIQYAIMTFHVSKSNKSSLNQTDC